MNDETVLITGASSGIGLELARCFAAERCRLVLVARRRTVLAQLADDLRRQYKTQSEVYPADLSQPETASRLFDHLETNGTRISVLVNNAGFGGYGTFAELSLEHQLRMLQVNVTTLTHLAHLLLPRMITAGRGGVLNVASTAGFAPGPRMAVYYATKAYVLSFTEALAEELRGTGVTASALCPGPTLTNFAQAANAQHSNLFRRSAMSAAAVAKLGHQGFRAGKPVVIAGGRNWLLVQAIRFTPRALVRRIVRFFNSASTS